MLLLSFLCDATRFPTLIIELLLKGKLFSKLECIWKYSIVLGKVRAVQQLWQLNTQNKNSDQDIFITFLPIQGQLIIYINQFVRHTIKSFTQRFEIHLLPPGLPPLTQDLSSPTESKVLTPHYLLAELIFEVEGNLFQL